MIQSPLFKNKLVLTPKDLLEAYQGQTGIWLVYTAPTRDEFGTTGELGYFEGRFEDVLKAAQALRRFNDCNMCGEILPIVPQKVPAG